MKNMLSRLFGIPGYEGILDRRYHSIEFSMIHCLSQSEPLTSDELLEHANANIKLRGRLPVSRGWMMDKLYLLEKGGEVKKIGKMFQRRYKIGKVPEYVLDYIEDVLAEEMGHTVRNFYLH